MSKQHVFEVEVEDFDDVEYCGCEFSTRIKKYGLFQSLKAGIESVKDREGPIIKDLLRGEDWMLSVPSLYTGSNPGATFTVHDTSIPGSKLMFVVRVQRVEVK